MFHRIGATALALASIAVSGSAMAQDNVTRIATRADDILAVLQQRKPAEEVFTPDFVTSITPAQLRVFAEQMEAGAGKLQAVESAEPDGEGGLGRIVLRFEKALGLGNFQLESRDPYRVAGFRITQFEPLDDSIAAVTAELQNLPGDAGIYLGPLDGSTAFVAVEDNRPFAIGSTFKLYVLSALVRSIAEGRHRWDEVVALDQKSLPSGVMQNWPDGAPVTLHTLATMMISISDNTATDQLIHVLGRTAVETEVETSRNAFAARNQPFLTTRELFALKAGPDSRLAAYAAAGSEGRRAILTEMAGEQPAVGEIDRAFADGPRALDVEWFASPRDVAGIMRQLVAQDDQTALAILAINSGLADGQGSKWAYVGYKGGSEPGVLNLSWLLRRENGEWWILSASWNNPAANIDQRRFEQLAHRLMALANPTDAKPAP